MTFKVRESFESVLIFSSQRSQNNAMESASDNSDEIFQKLYTWELKVNKGKILLF